MFKIKIEETTKQNIIALTISGAILILFFLAIDNIDFIKVFISRSSSILISFILGFFIAFVLSPLNKMIEGQLIKLFKNKTRACRIVSSMISLIIGMTLFTFFVILALPQLVDSLLKIMDILPNYLEMAENISDELLLKLNVDQTLADVIASYSDDLFSSFMDLASKYLPEIVNYSIIFGSTVLKFLISLIIALYIMIDKERFALQFTKMSYAFLNKPQADELLNLSRVSSNVFNRFIIGKALDSLIIGAFAYLGLTLMNMPFALLLSLIIGVTNMIPVFGPFIGAIPGIFILFIIDPIMVVWFIVFVLILQQIDGNIIGPAILGDSLGLPTLWIMFAIVVGGGFYGVLGMFFGVPVFGVIYFYIKRATERRLIKKNILLDEKKN
ncbi:MAG: AI-2E family transporter [Erysipelotrichaceae bacterium]|nr:AI-2E family transporter [Erysipelotrichaceae bacterium]MDD3923947.1 AI-2E family transporter [Erysipelotrichaceae bacterium]